MANYVAGRSCRSSCKSPRTLQKCNLLITRQLTFGAVLGEHKLSLPSTRLKVNHLCIRCLCFESVRGDLQEGQGCSSRCQLPLFGAYSSLPEHKIGVFVLFYPSEPPFSGVSSTKSGFLCAFTLRNPRFRAFRAQNWGFCAFLAFETPVFGLFEHKIGVFVRFYPSKPLFSGFSSTKSPFLCAFTLRNPRFRAFRAQNRGFCARI